MKLGRDNDVADDGESLECLGILSTLAAWEGIPLIPPPIGPIGPAMLCLFAIDAIVLDLLFPPSGLPSLLLLDRVLAIACVKIRFAAAAEKLCRFNECRRDLEGFWRLGAAGPRQVLLAAGG